MIAVKSSAVEPLRPGAVHEILQAPGPCITVLLPAYHAGETAHSSAALLKTIVQNADQQLSERGFRQGAIPDMLAPLHDLTHDPELLAGSRWGRAIFRSPDVFRQFQLMQPVPASFTIAGCFAVKHLLPELWLPRAFYVLSLAKDRVRLLHVSGYTVEAARLPGIPETLEEALAFEPPDHDLENRASAGPSIGAMRGVRFGTGSGRETQHAHLADFYKLIDRAIQQLAHEHEIPVLLAGVDEDTNMYRSGSACRTLVENSIHRSGDASAFEVEMLPQAYSLLAAQASERHAQALQELRQRVSPSRFCTDPDTILRAAFDGRVYQLYANESNGRYDVFERGEYRTWGREDLLNLAAVQTLIHGGDVFVVPEPTCAFFRF